MPDELDDYLNPAPRRRNNYDDLIEKHARRTNLDPSLVRAVVGQESGGNPRAVSPKGARGVMQLMPATAQRFGVRNIHDPEENIRGGTDYLKFLNDRFKGNRDLVLAGYNAGEGAVDKFKGIPPYKETQNYVRSINKKLGQQQGELDSYLDPLDDYLDKPETPPEPQRTGRFGTTAAPIKRFSRDPFAGLKAGAGGGQQQQQQAPQQPAQQRQLTPTESLLESIGGREKRGEDIQNILEGVTGAVGGTLKQVGNATDFITPITIANRFGRPNPVKNVLRRGGEYLEQQVAENEAARPAPTTIAGNIRRGIGKGVGASVVEMPKLLLGGRLLGAANLPTQGALARADEGYSGIAKGALGGLVYHYGGELTGKAFAGVSPYLAKAGNSLVWIAGPVAEQQIAAKVTGSEPPNLAQSIGENIPFGIMAGMGARGKVRVKTPRGERDATTADLPKIVKRELEVVPPERIEDARQTETQRQGVSPEQSIDTRSPEGIQLRPLAEETTRGDDVRDTVAADVRGINRAAETELPATVETPQRFRHVDFGEVEVAADQSGARRGRLKVQEVADPTRIHYVKKSDAQGRGNARMIPEKVEPETVRVEPENLGQAGKDLATPRTGLERQFVEPVEPQIVKPWEMSRSEVEAEFQRKKAEDANLEERILGPELAKRYKRLQQSANSSYDTKKADAAYDEIQKIEASLSETDRNRLYGIGETGPQVEDLRAYRQSLGNLDDSSPQALGESMRWAVSRVGKETDPLKMNQEQQIAFGTLREAARIAHENGWDTQKVSEIAVKAAGERFADPEDARMMLDRFIKKEPSPSQPVRPALTPKPETTSVEQGVKSDIEPYLDPSTAQPAEQATGRPLEPSVGEGALQAQPTPSPASVEHNGRTYTRNERGEWHREDGRIVRGVMEGKLNELFQQQKGGLRAASDQVASEAKTNQPIVSKATDEGVRQRAPLSEPTVSREAAELHAIEFEKTNPNVMWHGSPSGDLRGGSYGLHVGTRRAATQALEARIGVPAEGTWDGTREYGKTLLAGKKRLREIDPKGFNETGFNVDAPQENYYPTQKATYGDRSFVALDSRPDIFPIKVKGRMTNTRERPHEDFKANSLMQGQLKQGRAKSGYFYKQVGEDAGSISAVVPNSSHIERLPYQPPRPPVTTAPPFEPPPSTTAVKNASMAADRVAMDLPELARAEPRKAQQVHEQAIAANAKDPRQVDRLTEQALTGDKNFTDVETAQVRLRAQEIKNRTNELLREIDATNDPTQIKEKRLELDSLTNEFDRLTQATKSAGREWGRAGVARQQAIDQDFSLVAMKARLKADQGKPLTEEQNRRIEYQYKQIEELTAKLAEAEERAAQAQLQKQIDKVVRRGRRAETKAALDEEFAHLKDRFAEIRASQGVGAFFKSERGAFDPAAVKVIGEMARNRVKAGTVKAEALVDEIHAFIAEHVPDVSKRDVRDAISGYGLEPQGRKRSEAAQQLAKIRSELKALSTAEDVAAGKRLSRADKMRQTNLLKQEAELTRRMAEKDYSDAPKHTPPQYTRETYEIQKRLEGIKQQYAKDRYKATRSTGGKISDELAKAANVPKTLKSIGDISAVFRQGGFYALTHPVEGLAKPFREMVKSVDDMGWRNVEAEIKADPDFDTLRKAGVEFTGVDKSDPRLSKHEEGYLGQEYLQYVPVAKQVANFSERTFVSFLDAQRLYIGKQMLRGLTETQRKNPAELKAIARLINTGTGRGSLGRKGNSIAPALNIAMFSPRLLASRVQLLNNMINPVTIARMPAGARKRMIADNVKFLAATMATIQLARMSGATVSLDPDDAEFLKIRFGNTVYDQLTGLQQPLRFIINMSRAASPVDSKMLQAGSTYPGKSMKQQIDPFEGGSFTRSKLNPALSPLVNYAVGEDFMGRKFSASREARDLVVPLPANDVIEAMQQEGLIGLPKALPTFVGIGVGSYPPSPDRPTTHAEKLARRFIRDKMPDKAREEEEIDTDRAKAQARAKSRRGENVSADIAALKGKITPRQIKGILAARNKTRLEEDFTPLGINEATLVYSVADADQQRKLKPLLQKKIPLYYTLLPSQQGAVRERLNSFGIKVGAPRATQ